MNFRSWPEMATKAAKNGQLGSLGVRLIPQASAAAIDPLHGTLASAVVEKTDNAISK
jgi:hypothetical protein